MTRYCSLFRRLLSGESKGEEADEEEGNTHRESSQQGESTPSADLYLTVVVVMSEVYVQEFVVVMPEFKF